MQLAVGIAGHRFNKLPAEARSRIERHLSSIFAWIDACAAGEFARRPGEASAPRVRLVSNLAEGTDQIAIALRPAGWALEAILPFPRARYAMDFAPQKATGGIDRRADFEAALAQADSVVELADESDDLLGYERAGELLLQRSHLLVAVWDGEPRAGRGGTEAVIAAARSTRVPVIWIHAALEHAPMLLAGPATPAHPISPEALSQIVAAALGGTTP